MVNIYLMGPSGSGKTTTGKHVAKILNRKFINHDDVFEDQNGSIAKFGESHGWDTFITEASKILQGLSRQDNIVMAPIASAFANATVPAIAKQNYAQCKKNGVFVLLLPSRIPTRAVNILFQRETSRPYKPGHTYTPKLENTRKSYGERVPLLKKLADIIVYDNSSPKHAADKIVLELKRKKYLDPQ